MSTLAVGKARGILGCEIVVGDAMPSSSRLGASGGTGTRRRQERVQEPGGTCQGPTERGRWW